MDPTTEKTCLDEISTLVLDSMEKVTLKTISNNWSVHNKVAKEILNKWLEMNRKKLVDLKQEFIVTGINTKGVFSISVVPEEKIKSLEAKWKKFNSCIYSVEHSANTRSLGLPDFEPIKVKQILISASQPRDLMIPDIPVVVKTEPVSNKPKNPFETPKTTESKSKTVEVKKEVVKPISPEGSKSTPQGDTVKTETKSSPEEPKITAAKAPAGKKNQIKNQKPVQKGGITSFFSKPSTSKTGPAKSEATKQDEKKNKTETAIETSAKPDEKKASKRLATPEKSPAKPAPEPEKKKTKTAQKKIKLKPVGNKRSRIKVMEDSSDEEPEEKIDEPDSKFIKFDREMTPENQSPSKNSPVEDSPVKVHSKPDQQTENVKRKAKRYVKKRFQTEDGFMRTETVLEEYTASEDENDENKKKNSPPKVVEKKSVEKEKKSTEKKKAAAKPTQTSKITSFFTKK